MCSPDCTKMRVQAKRLCTASRTKRVIAGLTLIALISEAVNFLRICMVLVDLINSIHAVVFYAMVPLTVLLINAIVVREVRRRASSNAASNLGLQHHQSTSSKSAVPTIMLVTTSLIYAVLCSTWCMLYVVVTWTPLGDATTNALTRCFYFVGHLLRLVFAYNFYIYLITGKQFRSELHRVFCRCQ